MEFRKRFTTGLKDFTDFNYFHNMKRLIVMSAVLLVMVPLIWIAVGVGNLGEDWPLIFTVDPSMYLIYLLVIFLILLNFWQIKFISKRQYNSSRDMKVEKEVVIDETGIRASNEFGNYSSGWQDVFKASESKKAFYIYISKLQAHIIPKRFLDPGEDKKIRELVKQHLPASKCRLLSGMIAKIQ